MRFYQYSPELARQHRLLPHRLLDHFTVPRWLTGHMMVLGENVVGECLHQSSWSTRNSLTRPLSCHSLISFKSAILAPQQAKDKQMKNLTTPQAILGGLALIALAVASIPYSSNIVSPAQAYADRVSKVAICSQDGAKCADLTTSMRGNELQVWAR